jgi:hypothetical protein
MMHAVQYAAVETMKMMIKSFFALDVRFQFTNLVLDLKRFLRMIGYATIATLLVFRED